MLSYKSQHRPIGFPLTVLLKKLQSTQPTAGIGGYSPKGSAQNPTKHVTENYHITAGTIIMTHNRRWSQLSWSVVTNHLSRFISFWNFDAMFLNRLVDGSSPPAACNPDEGLTLISFCDSMLTPAVSRCCVTVQKQ